MQRAIKPGPVSRGERKPLTVRFSSDDRDHIRAEAERAGVSEGTYVYRCWCRAEGRPEPWWVSEEFEAAKQASEREELPMAKLA